MDCIAVVRPFKLIASDWAKDVDSEFKTVIYLVNAMHRQMLASIMKPRSFEDSKYPTSRSNSTSLSYMATVVLRSKKYQSSVIDHIIENPNFYTGSFPWENQPGAMLWHCSKNRITGVDTKPWVSINPLLMDEQAKRELMISKLKDDFVAPEIIIREIIE